MSLPDWSACMKPFRLAFPDDEESVSPANYTKAIPCFHDGSVSELREAIQVMADVQLGNRLRENEAEAIESFLKSLSGDVPRNYRQPSP